MKILIMDTLISLSVIISIVKGHALNLDIQRKVLHTDQCNNSKKKHEACSKEHPSSQLIKRTEDQYQQNSSYWDDTPVYRDYWDNEDDIDYWAKQEVKQQEKQEHYRNRKDNEEDKREPFYAEESERRPYKESDDKDKSYRTFMHRRNEQRQMPWKDEPYKEAQKIETTSHPPEDTLLSARWEGVRARPGEYPYVVYIRSEILHESCSGFIVAPSWIITCSYCFSNDSSHLQLDAVVIYAGVVTVPIEGAETQMRTSLTVITNSKNDLKSEYGYESPQLALIKTSEPFQFNDFVNSIRLTSPGLYENSAGYVCFVVGFTDASNPVVRQRLKWKQVAIANSIECQKRYGIFLYGRGLCSRGTEGRLSCRRDIGAPVVCNKLAVGVVTVRARLKEDGLTEFMFGCNDRFPINIYTFTGSYVSWVKTHVANLVKPGDSESLPKRKKAGRRSHVGGLLNIPVDGNRRYHDARELSCAPRHLGYLIVIIVHVVLKIIC